MKLAAFECETEWIALKENIQNATGCSCIFKKRGHNITVEKLADREDALHFIDMKKREKFFIASDGSRSNLFDHAPSGDNDCVVVKNGRLLTAPCDQSAFFVCENE
jgi:hypothetical protein